MTWRNLHCWQRQDKTSLIILRKVVLFPPTGDRLLPFNIMNKTFVYLILTLVIGVAIGTQFNLGGDQSQPVAEKPLPIDQQSTPNSEMTATDLMSIRQQFQREAAARQKLENQVAQLSEQLKDIEQQLFIVGQPANNAPAEVERTSETVRQDGEWFKEQALVDIGMEASQARMLKDFFEQQELQQLYLRDQSIREAWDRDKRREAFQALADETSAFLEQLDDDDYDAYLYASGQPNRVEISSVLNNAQAGAAGIEAGDHVLRYDNQRIYSGFELRQATSSGNIGDTVAVEIERDGNILEFYLERGPLGVRMDSVSVKPRR